MFYLLDRNSGNWLAGDDKAVVFSNNFRQARGFDKKPAADSVRTGLSKGQAAADFVILSDKE